MSGAAKSQQPKQWRRRRRRRRREDDTKSNVLEIPELLCHIFRFITKDTQTCDIETVASMRLVCRRWNEAMKHPRLDATYRAACRVRRMSVRFDHYMGHVFKPFEHDAAMVAQQDKWWNCLIGSGGSPNKRWLEKDLKDNEEGKRQQRAVSKVARQYIDLDALACDAPGEAQDDAERRALQLPVHGMICEETEAECGLSVVNEFNRKHAREALELIGAAVLLYAPATLLVVLSSGRHYCQDLYKRCLDRAYPVKWYDSSPFKHLPSAKERVCKVYRDLKFITVPRPTEHVKYPRERFSSVVILTRNPKHMDDYESIRYLIKLIRPHIRDQIYKTASIKLVDLCLPYESAETHKEDTSSDEDSDDDGEKERVYNGKEERDWAGGRSRYYCRHVVPEDSESAD